MLILLILLILLSVDATGRTFHYLLEVVALFEIDTPKIVIAAFFGGGRADSVTCIIAG